MTVNKPNSYVRLLYLKSLPKMRLGMFWLVLCHFQRDKRSILIYVLHLVLVALKRQRRKEGRKIFNIAINSLYLDMRVKTSVFVV